MEAIPAGKRKPHAVCVPLPFQSHINAMLKLAKILHFKGFHITFVNTEFNHQRILLSRGPDSLNGLPDFRFQTIPDGLPPPSDINSAQEFIPLFNSINKTSPSEFHKFLTKLHKVDPPVSCIVSDLTAIFTDEIAQELAIPQIIWYPVSATILIYTLYSDQLFQKFSNQLKDNSHLTNEFLDMPVDFIPGLEDFHLKDFLKCWDVNAEAQDTAENHNLYKQTVTKASAIILNTFDDLEGKVLHAIKAPADCSLPTIYTMGPLHFFESQITNKGLASFGSSLLKEDQDCFEWLDSQQPNSVLYVSFGSTTVMSSEHFFEFAWGLANSKHPFLWAIRPNLIIGEAVVLPPDFFEETADRGMITGWCPQEKVLGHSSVGGFLTHCGWSSIMDAMCSGVPILTWPYFGDQQPNSTLACDHWGIGMQMNENVKREDLEGLVKELMVGEKGKEFKRKSMEWKRKAEESTKPGGSSYVKLDKLIKEVLTQKKLD